jgi:hypothetical protein
MIGDLNGSTHRENEAFALLVSRLDRQAALRSSGPLVSETSSENASLARSTPGAEGVGEAGVMN